jgi:hypothetical protein
MLLLSQFVFSTESISSREKQSYAILFVVIFIVLFMLVLAECVYSAVRESLQIKSPPQTQEMVSQHDGPKAQPGNGDSL